MKSWILTQSNRRVRVVWLGVAAGLATLFLAVLLGGLREVTLAHANPSILYVDGAAGQDTVTCGTTGSPCRTISYTLNSRASGGNTIRVAQGVYTENLTVDKQVALEGGYESVGWTRNITQHRTIIDGSNSRTVWGDWDGRQVVKPSVISDGTTYKMWFDGRNLLDEAQVGLAISNDGISWTKYAANPVLTGTVGAWDGSGEHGPFVLKESGVYKMWYEGYNGNVRQLGYATSTNGIDWNKYPGSPVLEAGPESYDQDTAGHGSVLNDRGTYKLWYHAMGNEGLLIAYATSPDGLNWTKQGPVLRPESRSWDTDSLWGPSVLKISGSYWMWYAAWGWEGWTAVGVVTSTNGITWTRFLAAPVITETGWVGDPHVISDGGKLKMWYNIWHEDGTGDIAYAESDDGISWTKSPSNPVLTPGTPGHWGQPVVKFVAGSGGSVLDGFTVQNGEAERGGGIYVNGASPTVSRCAIVNNTGYYAGGGVYISGDAFPLILASQILSNTAIDWRGGGLAVMDGASFTLTTSTVAGNNAPNGAGLAIRDGATPLIADNNIVSNTASWAGGGIRVIASGGTIQNNRILSNTAQRWAGGAMEIAVNAWTTVVSNSIVGNVADSGGGIAVNWHCTATITANEIVSNTASDGTGGGVYISDYSAVRVDRNKITNNTTSSGGGGIAIVNGSAVTVTNNVIGLNMTWYGDGIYVSGDAGSDVRILNNTIVSNSAESVQANNGTVLVRNNILYGNDGGILNYQSGATVSSDHNVFWNNGWNYANVTPGTGDISGDPLFVDAASGDYHLSANSPAIDAGTPDGAPDTDIEGRPRDAMPDIGAYEWHGFGIYLPLVVRN